MYVCFGSSVDGRRNGHERRFGAKIALPESGLQHMNVIQGRRSHDRPGVPHAQLSPGGGIHVIAHTNELREGHDSWKCGCIQIVKIAKPDAIHHA